jgi:hypothetical protein
MVAHAPIQERGPRFKSRLAQSSFAAPLHTFGVRKRDGRAAEPCHIMIWEGESGSSGGGASSGEAVACGRHTPLLRLGGGLQGVPRRCSMPGTDSAKAAGAVVFPWLTRPDVHNISVMLWARMLSSVRVHLLGMPSGGACDTPHIGFSHYRGATHDTNDVSFPSPSADYYGTHTARTTTKPNLVAPLS